MADARGEREAAIKDLSIVAGEFEIDPIPVRSKQSDVEAFRKKLISSIQLICRFTPIPVIASAMHCEEGKEAKLARKCFGLRGR